MHWLGLLLVAFVIVFTTAMLLWNFVPSWRDKMRGYSTIVEGAIMALTGILANVTGALQDAQAAGYMPPQLMAYVPIVFVVWFLLKRFQTTTPVGGK